MHLCTSSRTQAFMLFDDQRGTLRFLKISWMKPTEQSGCDSQQLACRTCLSRAQQHTIYYSLSLLKNLSQNASAVCEKQRHNQWVIIVVFCASLLVSLIIVEEFWRACRIVFICFVWLSLLWSRLSKGHCSRSLVVSSDAIFKSKSCCHGLSWQTC